MIKKINLKDLQQLARHRDGELISHEIRSLSQKFIWKCKNNHVWHAKYYTIKEGKWCIICAGKQIGNIDQLKSIAQLKNGQCLNNYYINNTTKYKFICQSNHTFLSTAKAIKKGHWCRECSYEVSASKNRGKSKYTIKDLHMAASKRSGYCLSDKYNGYLANYTWQCKNGHTWNASFKNVYQHKTWCSSCIVTHSKAELEIFNFVKILFPDAQNGRRSLLKNKLFELDIYIPSLNKAIEFNGQYWHSSERAKRNDRLKSQQCKEASIDLYIIDEIDYIKYKNAILLYLTNWLSH